MKITIDDVEDVIDTEIKTSPKCSSSYIYFNKNKYKGKKAKICILKK